MTMLNDRKILIIATDGFEQSELDVPRDALRAAGAAVMVATPTGEAIKGWKDEDWGDEAAADLKIADAKAADYDAIVLPGGNFNPDKLRIDPDAIQLIKDFDAAKKPVAAICHAPWLLAEAGIADGRRLTSYTSIRTDLKNAGATVVDEPVVVDGHIITSRAPDDLDAFIGAIKDAVAGR